MGRTALVKHVLENAPDYCLGPDIQDQLSCQVKEDKEEVGPTLHQRTCKSQTTLGGKSTEEYLMAWKDPDGN